MASSSRPTIGGSSSKAPKSPESFESLAHRNHAAEILQSYEILSWHSFQRCESLTQTRLHFQNIVAGFTDEDEASLVDWKTDNSPRLKPGEGPRSRKGKERVSSGDVGDGVAGSSAQKTDKAQGTIDAGASTSGGASKKRKSGSGS